MLTATLPRLTAMGHELDTSPECFGEMESSIDLIDDPRALRERMREEGYLYLPGYLDAAGSWAAREVCLERLADANIIEYDRAMSEGNLIPGRTPGFRPELAKGNEPLLKLLYTGAMMEFYEKLLGGPVRHFDYTWLRSVAQGNGTPPHCDVVYMSRGTTDLYTSWTPLGDAPLELGGLMVLEKSHRIDRLRNNYGRKDVDKFCINRRPSDYTKMGGGGNISESGWLSNNPVKLRANLGGRWLTADYKAGDLVSFSVYMVHGGMDNQSNRIRLSSDSRYQLASEPVDERWIGENPIAHGPAGKRGMIC